MASPLRIAPLALALLAVGCGGGAPEPPRDPLLVRYDQQMAEARALRASPEYGWVGAPAPLPPGPMATLEATMTGQPATLAYPRAKRKPIPLTVPAVPYEPSTPPYRVHYGK